MEEYVRMTVQCKECGKEFVENRPFQVFCNDCCRGAYHRRKYRRIAVEEAEDRREARLNGHGTPEERQKANEVLAKIIQKSRPKLVRRI
jgi:hypothetical protein